MLRTTPLVIFLFIVRSILGQTPHIDKVERIISYPLTTIEITGSGFSNDMNQLRVWFGHVKGTITFATETRIQATVPAQAQLRQVEVINLVSKRSGKSALKLMPNFNGKQPFANNFVSTPFSNPDDIFDLCSCDFDGDGKPDIAGTKFKDGKQNLMLLINQSTVQTNSSTLSFSQVALPLNFPTFSPACGDINGDGKPELVVSRGGTITGNTVYIFPNTSSGSVSFGAAVPLDLMIGDFAKEVAVHDMNGDGRPDIIVTNGATGTLYIFENQLTSATIAANQFTRHDISAGTATLALDIADVSGDGWPDILASPNTNAQKIIVLKNPANGSLTFAGATNVSVGGSSNINDIATADFNNDGSLDFVVADRGTGKAYVYLNRGSLLFQSVNSTTGFASPVAWGVDVGDMNGDGLADFVIGSRDFVNPQVNIFISNGAATPSFTATKIVTTKAIWFPRVGDFDGDAKPDIAVTATNNSTQFTVDIIKNKNCHQPIIFNENPLSICNGQTIVLNALPLPAVAFTWSTGDTGPSTSITFANAGTVTLTAVGEGGACSEQTNITVNQGLGTAPAKPVISGPDGVCAGSSLTLTTGSVAGTPTYSWSGPNGFSSETTTPSIAVTNSATSSHAGSYSLVVKVGECTSDRSDPKVVSVVEPEAFTITSSAGNTGVCSGQSVTLSVNPVSGYNYQWKKGGTNIGGQTNPTLTINPVAASNAGSYTVFISHQAISCSSETSPFTLSVVNAPVASFTTSPSQICVGTEVLFNGTGSTVDNTATPSYSWDFGDSGSGTGSIITHVYQNASASVTAKLTVSYTGISSCSNSITKNLAVSAATPPIINTDPVVTEICNDGSESVVLSVTGDFSSYLWTPGNNATSSITVKASGTYQVTTTDANGCSGKAEIILAAKAECAGGAPPPINISPLKVFTPNNDGQNDYWEITNVTDYPECTMSVFDGSGRRVYESKNYPAIGWDGMGNVVNNPVPDGTYYFVFGCPNGNRVSGSVLIVRK